MRLYNVHINFRSSDIIQNPAPRTTRSYTSIDGMDKSLEVFNVTFALMLTAFILNMLLIFLVCCEAYDRFIDWQNTILDNIPEFIADRHIIVYRTIGFITMVMIVAAWGVFFTITDAFAEDRCCDVGEDSC